MNTNKNTNQKTSALTLGALFAALSVIFLYLAGVLPTLRLASVAIAGAFTAAMLLSAGAGYSLLLFAAVSLLSLFLLPNKVPPILYALFFGYYPIIKYLIEKLRNVPLEWFLKLLSFNFSFTLIVYLSTKVSGISDGFSGIPFSLLYLVGNGVFVFFDIAFSSMIVQMKNRFFR